MSVCNNRGGFTYRDYQEAYVSKPVGRLVGQLFHKEPQNGAEVALITCHRHFHCWGRLCIAVTARGLNIKRNQFVKINVYTVIILNSSGLCLEDLHSIFVLGVVLATVVNSGPFPVWKQQGWGWSRVQTSEWPTHKPWRMKEGEMLEWQWSWPSVMEKWRGPELK